MILILSSPNDVHVAHLRQLLIEKQVEFVEIDTGLFPEQLGISLYMRASGEIISTMTYANGEHVSLGNIKSVWFRKPSDRVLTKFSPEINSFVSREVEDTLFGLLNALELGGARLLNHPLRNRVASCKPLQLQIAAKVGLTIPNSLISNQPASAAAFLDETPDAISKGVSRSWAEDGNTHYAIFVRSVGEHERKAINALKWCPSTFQERVSRYCDLRVIAVGEDMFAVEIHHPLGKEEDIDWRLKVDDGVLRYVVHDLPDSVKIKLRKYMEEFHITFGAFDLILTDRGDYVFLECNANGQWLWLEHATGLAIGKSICNQLTWFL